LCTENAFAPAEPGEAPDSLLPVSFMLGFRTTPEAPLFTVFAPLRPAKLLFQGLAPLFAPFFGFAFLEHQKGWKFASARHLSVFFVELSCCFFEHFLKGESKLFFFDPQPPVSCRSVPPENLLPDETLNCARADTHLPLLPPRPEIMRLRDNGPGEVLSLQTRRRAVFPSPPLFLLPLPPSALTFFRFPCPQDPLFEVSIRRKEVLFPFLLLLAFGTRAWSSASQSPRTGDPPSPPHSRDSAGSHTGEGLCEASP